MRVSYAMDGYGPVHEQIERCVLAAAADGRIRVAREAGHLGWQFMYPGHLVELGCRGTVLKLEREGRLAIDWSVDPPTVRVSGEDHCTDTAPPLPRQLERE